MSLLYTTDKVGFELDDSTFCDNKLQFFTDFLNDDDQKKKAIVLFTIQLYDFQ